jgi:acyl-CoA synthetase (NDP forming)
MRDLSPLLAPRSVAVIGASTNPSKSGGILFKNLVDGGYGGLLYPINPRADSVLGHRAYPRISETPGPVDLAFIVLPRAGVREALADCGARGVRAACIVTAGFAEAGETGRRDEEALRTIAREKQILTVGPNTIGIVVARHQLFGSFVPFPSWEPGPISIFAQTGIFGGAIMLQAMSQDAQRPGIGLSLDVGNKVDVDELDFLEFARQDPATTVIGLYLEGIRDPRAFLKAAGQVKDTKPVVVLRPGRTRDGARASASHTGALALDDRVLDAALRQYGIVRADDAEDFLAYLKALAWLPLPAGRRVGIVTYSGALGVMATDDLVQAGLHLAEFSTETLGRLAQVLPDWQAPGNPSDLWAALDVRGNRAGHEEPFEAVLSDPQTDMVLGLLLAPPNADFPEVREVFSGLRSRHPDKPLVLVIYGGEVRGRWVRELEGLHIPVYPSPRAAVRSLWALASYSAARRKSRGTREPLSPHAG